MTAERRTTVERARLLRLLENNLRTAREPQLIARLREQLAQLKATNEEVRGK